MAQPSHRPITIDTNQSGTRGSETGGSEKDETKDEEDDEEAENGDDAEDDDDDDDDAESVDEDEGDVDAPETADACARVRESPVRPAPAVRLRLSPRTIGSISTSTSAAHHMA
jgi:hypothetical protein